MGFDLQNYLATSKSLDISDIAWGEVGRHPVSPETVRSLVYMMDIEAHTLCYLRDLLNSNTASDPEISDFLACWLYEESYHGRAFERFLKCCNLERPVAVCGARKTSLGERFQQAGVFVLSGLTRHFSAVHMTWGAINELTTLTAYRRLSEKCGHPILVEILRRIMRDESRHFSFYFHKAEQKLSAPAAQRLTRWLLKGFWAPVGSGVKPQEDVDFLFGYLFADEEGEKAVRHADQTIGALPGMGWFDLVERARNAGLARIAGENAEVDAYRRVEGDHPAPTGGP